MSVQRVPACAVLIVGVSGTGKGTIAQALLGDLRLDLRRLVLHTSRKKGSDEVNGDNYWFIGETEFEDLVKHDRLLSSRKFLSGYYGISKQVLLETLASGHNLLCEADLQTGEELIAFFQARQVSYLEFFISPVLPELLLTQEGRAVAISEIEKRIRKRKRGETEDDILSRVGQAKIVFANKRQYRYEIANFDGKEEQAIAAVKQLVILHLCSSIRPGLSCS